MNTQTEKKLRKLFARFKAITKTKKIPFIILGINGIATISMDNQNVEVEDVRISTPKGTSSRLKSYFEDLLFENTDKIPALSVVLSQQEKQVEKLYKEIEKLLPIYAAEEARYELQNFKNADQFIE